MLRTLSPLAPQTAPEKDWLLHCGAGEMNLLLFILPPLCPQSRYLTVTAIRWM